MVQDLFFIENEIITLKNQVGLPIF